MGEVVRRSGGGLKMMNETEKKRIIGGIYWLEDLERAGLTYWDLLGYMESLNVKCVVSPVHDKDTYVPEDVRNWVTRHMDPDTGDVATEYSNLVPSVGDPKKPHIHFGFKLTRQMTRHEASEILLDGFLAYPETKWAVIPDWDSYCCYMCHKYNPNKAYYPPQSVQAFGGVDLSKVYEVTEQEKFVAFTDLMAEIQGRDFRYFHQIWQWVQSQGDETLAKAIRANHAFITSYLYSKRQQRLDEKAAKKANGSQGEKS